MYGPVLVNFTALHPKRYLQPYIMLVFLVPFPSNQAPSSSLPIDPGRHLRRYAPAGNSLQFGSNSSGWCSTSTVVAISGVGVSVIPVAKVIFNDRDVVWNSMSYSKAQTDRPTRCSMPQIHRNTNFSRTTFYVLVLKVLFDVLPMNATGSLKPEIVEVILYFAL